MSQMTFTEAEVTEMVNCYNFFYNKAKWNFESTKEAMELHKHIRMWATHIKKMEDHIMELRQILENKEKEASSETSEEQQE